jgi:hypothetical protein
MLAATGSPPSTAMQPSRVRALRGAVDDEVPSGEWSVSRDGNAFELRLSRAAAAVIGPGSWLRLDFAAEPTPLPSVTLFLLVEEARESAAAMSSGALLSPADGEGVSVLGRRAWWMLDAADGWSLSADRDFQAATVALDLWVRHPRRSPWRMERLGLTAADPRYLGYLPSDSDLFAPRERSDSLPGAALRAAAAQPRFPLAGQPFGDEPPLFIPLGVPPLPRDDLYQPAAIPLGTPLERDGLRTFDEHLFLDPDLAGETVATLPTAAFFKQYQRPAREGGGPPVGLYALLGTAEASLFAVPDAVQRGWVSRTEERQLLGAPALAPVDGPDDEARLTLSWRAEPLADAYTVEESPDAQFARAVASTRVERNTTVTLVRRSECPAVLYFRVRAEAGRDLGPWSNTERSSLSAEPFTPCGLVPFDAPTLEPFEPAALEPASASRRLHLAWYGGAADADEYVLEMAADAGFASAQQVYTGTSTTTDLWAPGGDVAYFRVAALRRGERSPWSNTISTSASIIQRWELLPLEEPERHGEPGTNESILRRIHRAMLRIAAARSDIFAVLSLPAHYRERAALTYRGRLAADLGGDAEARTLSFGALYHPATVVRDHSGSAVSALRLLVPDGSVCGRIASRASAAGAWVAPANELLEGVVMLEPTLAADAPAIFAGQPCNILQPQPRGFVLWSDATLSDDRELRAIGVRRLLILLRRLALREGNTFVFESNGDSFRRLVQRQFDRVLGDLFRRGAFAGATADEAYRVVTDRSVNTRQSLDAGRFIIEWRVAPSSPLAFLTVRLVHTGSELLLQEA